MIDQERMRLARQEALDNIDDVTEASYVESIIRTIHKRLSLPEFDITLPQNATYLALGAGQAHAEIALANGLGIEGKNITLLDKRFSRDALRRFRTIGFTGTRKIEDMFQYFDTPKPEKFDVISSFGMEYVFETDQRLIQLMVVLSTNLNINGIAIVSPSVRSFNIEPVWNKHGFVSLGGSVSGTAMVRRDASKS